MGAPPAAARQLAARCRDIGLEPLMLFSTLQLEGPAAAVPAHLRRIDQAAAGIPCLLTFGKTTAGQYGVFIGNLK